MKNRKFILRFFILLVIYSCQSNIDKNEYFTNGKISKEFFQVRNGDLTKVINYSERGDTLSILFLNKEGNLDSVCHYFKNGVLSTVSYINGDATGLARWYFPNRRIKEDVNLYKGHRKGMHKYFNMDGSLYQINFYRIIDDSSFFNGIIRVDDKGSIIPDSSEFAEIHAIKDTIKKGELFNYEFRMYLKPNLLARAFIGNFDENFNVLDSLSLEHLDIDIINQVKPTQIGENILRIIFETKENIRPKEDGGELLGKMYLEKKYFVKD